MKTITSSSSDPPAICSPDFGGRPWRINLDQLTAVKGYGKLLIRPIRLDDEPEMIRFHERISEESVYMRYFEYLGLDHRTSHERLVRICANTPESYAVVIEWPAAPHHPATILAVGRLTVTLDQYAATFDMLIVDEKKAPQLGKLLLNRLIKLAHFFGFKILTSDLLVADHDTLNLCRSLGFSLQTLPQDGLVRVTLDI